MKKRSKRAASRTRAKAKPTKRLEQIQRVFDQLGIGNEEARRSVLSLHPQPIEQPVQYRIVLAGSTLG